LEIEVCLRTAEAEPCLVLTVEDDNIESRRKLHLCEPLARVRGIPNCACRYRTRSTGAKLSCKRLHSAECGDCSFACLATELACLLDAGTEARRGFHFIDNSYLARWRNIGDDLADRIAPNIDRRDADVSFRFSPRSGV
jgi:hypothetical protein